MSKDTLEQHDLSKEYPEIVKDLFAAYKKWIATCPPAIQTNGHQRINGKAMMNRYQQKFKEIYGVNPRVRPVITNEPDSSLRRYEERTLTGR